MILTKGNRGEQMIDKNKINRFLLAKIDPVFIILFGSQANGCARPDSDVDIAFFKENHGLSAYDIFMLAQEVAIKLNVEFVDLTDLRNANTIFKSEIFQTGIPLYIKNQYKYDMEELVALRMLVKLKEEQKELREEILKSGCVYGKPGSHL